MWITEILVIFNIPWTRAKMTYNIEPSALRGLCMVWGIIPWMKMKDNPFGGLGGDVLTNLDN